MTFDELHIELQTPVKACFETLCLLGSGIYEAILINQHPIPWSQSFWAQDFSCQSSCQFSLQAFGDKNIDGANNCFTFFWMQFLCFNQVWRDITPTLYLLYFTPIISIYIRQKCLFFYIFYISFGNPATASRCVLF